MVIKRYKVHCMNKKSNHFYDKIVKEKDVKSVRRKLRINGVIALEIKRIEGK